MKIKKLGELNGDVLFIIEDEIFSIPNEIYNYLDRNNLFENIKLKRTNTGVISLKFPITYKHYPDSHKIEIANIKQLNLYKENSADDINKFINNEKEKSKMFKVSIRFMKKKDNDKKSFFESFVNKKIRPKFYNVEFESAEDVKKTLEDAIKEVSGSNSIWNIEDNTKSLGYVVKNQYRKTEDSDFINHTVFVNIYEV